MNLRQILNRQFLLIFGISLWLVACQLCFLLVQQSLAERQINSVQIQLHQELEYSNYHYLVRSLTDFDRSGAVRCTVAAQTYPRSIDLLDLRYMSDDCNPNDLRLSGHKSNVELTAINGDRYLVEFITNNDLLFYVALWSLRFFGLIAAYLIYRVTKLHLDNVRIRHQAEIEKASLVETLSAQVLHDIKSPLTALESLVYILNKENFKHIELLRDILKRVRDISNDLSFRPKSEISGIASLERVNLTPFLSAIVSEKRLEFHADNKLFFEEDYRGEDINCLADTPALGRIVSNIVNNAVESIPNRNGTIRICVEIKNGNAIISISDSGVGMTSETLNDLGRLGFSFGKSTEQIAGTRGLGIYHAKNALKAMGGSIEFSSEFGRGTSVRIKLKRPAVANSTNP